MNSRNLIITDLDGTLLKGNSLIIFCGFLLKKLLFSGHIKDLSKLLLVLAKRKAGICRHREMKHVILKVGEKNLSGKDFENFAKKLTNNINKELLNFISQLSIKNDILIATAAPDLYLTYFLKDFKIPRVSLLATKWIDNLQDFKELSGCEKLDAVKNYLSENNIKPSYIFSDHTDDLPLFTELEGEKYLVNPSKKTKKELSNHFKVEKISNKNMFILKSSTV